MKVMVLSSWRSCRDYSVMCVHHVMCTARERIYYVMTYVMLCARWRDVNFRAAKSRLFPFCGRPPAHLLQLCHLLWPQPDGAPAAHRTRMRPRLGRERG